MAHRIEVAFRLEFVDALGHAVCERIRSGLHLPVRDVRTIDVYTLDAQLSSQELELLAKELFTDPVVQLHAIDEPLPSTTC